MKKLMFILYILIAHSLSAQITLKECIESGIVNRPNIKSARTELLSARLKSIETRAKYLPQLSLAYDFRYNPVIATQIVPVGQFNSIPTDETRAIQFGTNWQQNAGITVYQPLIDFSVQSRIKESKLNESLYNMDMKKAETDLIYEIVKTYSRVITLNFEVDQTIADTIRSYQSYTMVEDRFREGRVLKTEVNNAFVNHITNLTTYRKTVAALINEKIFLQYLTNISLERMLDDHLLPIPESVYDVNEFQQSIQPDSIADFQKLKIKELLINQQIKTERSQYRPTIGLQGFLGANQFSQTFDPFTANSWFGSSYVGVGVKLPIFSPEKSVTAARQLQLQLVIVNNQKDELKSERNNELLRINTDIQRLTEEIGFTQHSFTLLNENVKLFQERVQNGQLAAKELNVQEAELQKLSNQLKQLKAQLNEALVKRLHITGKLNAQIKTL